MQLPQQENGWALLCIGAFWNDDVNLLNGLANMSPDFMLYEVPLMCKLSRLSWCEDADMRSVFRDTLVEWRPGSVVVSLLCFIDKGGG